MEHNLPVSGGVLSSGELLFQGRADGMFRSYRADNGEVVWEFDAKTGIAAPAISYKVNGTQYVAIMAGWGGPEVLWNTGFGRGKVGNGRLLVFALGHDKALAYEEEKLAQVIPDFEVKANEEELFEGSVLYTRHCARCHGVGAHSSGLTPDLRFSSTAVHQEIETIVLGGAREVLGMPSFKGDLNLVQLKNIQAYILTQSKLAVAQR